MKLISVYNNKGGVGKTTSVINIAYVLSCLRGYKVLIIDGDGQQNVSRFFADEQKTGIDKLILNNEDYNKAKSKTRYENIDVIVSSEDMNNLSSELINIEDNEDRLQRIKTTWENEYDYILIDLPPTLNYITKQFLKISDGIVVPIELNSFSLQGIRTVTETINEVNSFFVGAFISKFDYTNSADLKLLELLESSLGNAVLKTKIKNSKVVKNSVNYKLTSHEYMHWTDVCSEWVKLTEEIIERLV